MTLSLFGEKRKIIRRFQKILSRHYGGVFKRIDETRELFELIQHEVPELLAKRPWIVGWFEAQDGFLQDLAATSTLSNIQFPPRTGPSGEPVFPRPWSITAPNIPETPKPPDDFLQIAKHAERYLDRKQTYQWTPITKGTKVPKGETCIVLCGPSDSLQAETRCIAFAAFVRGHVRWYGITDTHQTPIELSRVVCFVREADVKRRFAQEGKLF